jgi:hypothetical protein
MAVIRRLKHTYGTEKWPGQALQPQLAHSFLSYLPGIPEI